VTSAARTALDPMSSPIDEVETILLSSSEAISSFSADFSLIRGVQDQIVGGGCVIAFHDGKNGVDASPLTMVLVSA
jgi:hypothetical protein